MVHGLAALDASAMQHSYRGVEIEPEDNKNKPPAGLYTAVAIYFLCGNAVLLPWNAFITAVDYFGSIYPGMHTDRLFTVCYLPLAFLTLLLSTVIHNERAARRRALVSFSLFFLTVLAVPLIDAGTHGQGSVGSLAAVCCLLALAGVLDGLGQGALFGTAAALGPLVVEGLVGGTATSGILVSVLRVITKAAYRDTRQGLRVAAAAYFGVAAFFVLACFFLYALVLPRLPIIRALQRAARGVQQDGSDLALGRQDEKPGRISLRDLSRTVWILAATVVLIYVLTLAIFPGVLAEDVSNSNLGSWYPVILILLYNVGDFTGKMTPVIVPAATVSAPVAIFACAVARLAFVPAYFFAAREGVAAAMMVLTALLGVSNGLVTVWAMVAAPAVCASAKLKDLAGNVMITCLVLGLLLGSGCSFFWLIGRGW